MDTVTLLAAAIRGLLKVAEGRLKAELRAVLASGDDYERLAKPQIDWDDQAARAPLIDVRARDAHAMLGCCRTACYPRRWPRLPAWWRRWRARIWSRTPMAAS